MTTTSDIQILKSLSLSISLSVSRNEGDDDTQLARMIQPPTDENDIRLSWLLSCCVCTSYREIESTLGEIQIKNQNSEE